MISRASDRRLLAEASALIPRIVATCSGSLAVCEGSPVVVREELTSTGVAVMFLAAPHQPPCAVVKMSMNTAANRGMAQESGALAALHADERLGSWRALIPRPLVAGTMHGRQFRLDSALPGRVLLDQIVDADGGRRLLACAAETIHVMHRATATRVVADEGVAERWVDAQLQHIAGPSFGRRHFDAALRRLREELHGAVIGRAFSVSRVHGDFWLGNLLFSAGGTRAAGIVDWDAAGSGELPLIDLLHLLLYTRRMTTGHELGEIICDQLYRGLWSPDERHLLDMYGTWCNDGSLSDRHVLLLYWLRHAAHRARQDRGPAGYRYRLWARRNVAPVLRAL